MKNDLPFFLLVFIAMLLISCARNDKKEETNMLCQDGATRKGAACGLNDRGYLPEKCVQDQWVSNGNCVDPDWCKDGDTWLTTEGCGLNGNGAMLQQCSEGQWIDTYNCKDPDVCVNGTTQKIACGYNGNGQQAQTCLEGQWANDGECIDPDECENGTWKTEAGIVSECVEGKWVLRRTTKQWGTPSTDGGGGVAIDDTGNMFVTGFTDEALDGNTSAGTRDIFLTKWNADGSKEWTKQWGSGPSDRGYAVAVDTTGNIFVTGATYGSLDGNINAQPGCGDPTVECSTDVFLTKWNADGTKAWTKQWGTKGEEFGFAVTIDSTGNIFVTGMIGGLIDGNTNDGVDCDSCTEGEQPCAPIFLTKWNTDGAYVWTKQWGADQKDWGAAVSVDASGNIFVTGGTNGSLDGNTCIKDSLDNCSGDIFLTKLLPDGTKAWTKLWGTTKLDYGKAVVVDSNGHAFVTGFASAPLDENTTTGTDDIFLSKWDTDGTKIWFRQWGSLQWDYANAIIVDAKGDILIAGSTLGSLEGYTSAGDSDIFLTKWYNDGTQAWTRQWGTEVGDNGHSVAVDKSGNIFVAGATQGSLDDNVLLGETDIFLTIFPPE